MRKISAASILALTLALTPACGKMAKKKDIPGPNDKVYSVGVAAVVSRDIPDAIDLKGSFSPSERLQVKSDFTGKVQALSVIEGQQVAAGETLLKIDDEKLPYVLERQRAELREAEAQLELDSNRGTSDGTVDAIETAIEDLAAAQQEAIEDANPPIEEDNAAQDVVTDEASPAAEPTESTPFPRRFPFRRFPRRPFGSQRATPTAPAPAVPAEASEDRVALDQARVDRIKAELAISERQLAGSTIQAAVDGFVAKIPIAEGSMVKPEEVLVEIVKIDPIELTLQLPKEDIARLDKNMEARVTVPDLGGETFGGEISFIGAELDPVKKTLELRIRVANQALRIKGGMEGIANLAIANKSHQGLLVPANAVQSDGTRKYVYVVRGQVAEKREVETGVSMEGLIEIKSGLRNGDRVVVNGLGSLKEDEEFVKISG
ncbi:MAG TPA: efflux RND transporter periplasmic adaptor subunit [bacterium]|nr:efflux RND transporter periplasmic adaptor subunit [bacterium]